jgi:PAS domain S-box-containing protein
MDESTTTIASAKLLELTTRVSIAEAEVFFLRGIIERMGDAMLVVRADGLIIRANLQASLLLGYQPAALIGMSIDTLVPDAQRAGHPALRAGYLEHPETKTMSAFRAVHARRHDGRDVAVEIKLSQMLSDFGSLTIAVVRERT